MSELEIREVAATWRTGPPASTRTISLPGSERAGDLRSGPDGCMWLVLDEGLATIDAGGEVSLIAPPPDDRFGSFGFLGTGILLSYRRNAHAVEFRDLAGRADGRTISLTSKMKFPRFQPGPLGTEWISSIRAARVIWVRPDGSRDWTEEFSSTGYAMTADGLMWGLSDGLFALDIAGVLKKRVYFEGDGVPHTSDDGAIWFADGPGPSDDEIAPFRINRYDPSTNVLERFHLPAGLSVFELCTMPFGRVAFTAWDGSTAYLCQLGRDGVGIAHKVAGAQLLASLARDAKGSIWCADHRGTKLFVATL